MEEIGISELKPDQLEKLCEIGEKAARDHVLSKVPKRNVTTLDITVDAQGSKPVTVNVEVEVNLSPLMKNYDVEKLAKEATDAAFAAIKRYLSEL